jgi:cyclin-dependent kinase 12/13
MQDRISNNNINMRKPPPPPPSGLKRAPMARPQVPPQKRQRAESVSIMAPVVLRDVTVFEKKQQVGQGTYGSVFVGADKVTGGIVALKRINTEQEENGFPITAIREVKILKALNHPNIVDLKEIVTSKGEFASICKLLTVCVSATSLNFDIYARRNNISRTSST